MLRYRLVRRVTHAATTGRRRVMEAHRALTAKKAPPQMPYWAVCRNASARYWAGYCLCCVRVSPGKCCPSRWVVTRVWPPGSVEGIAKGPRLGLVASRAARQAAGSGQIGLLPGHCRQFFDPDCGHRKKVERTQPIVVERAASTTSSRMPRVPRFR